MTGIPRGIARFPASPVMVGGYHERVYFGDAAYYEDISRR